MLLITKIISFAVSFNWRVVIIKIERALVVRNGWRGLVAFRLTCCLRHAARLRQRLFAKGVSFSDICLLVPFRTSTVIQSAAPWAPWFLRSRGSYRRKLPTPTPEKTTSTFVNCSLPNFGEIRKRRQENAYLHILTDVYYRKTEATTWAGLKAKTPSPNCAKNSEGV